MVDVRVTAASGTSTDWAASTLVLSVGQLAWETDTLILRVGDGENLEPNLPIAASAAGGGGVDSNTLAAAEAYTDAQVASVTVNGGASINDGTTSSASVWSSNKSSTQDALRMKYRAAWAISTAYSVNDVVSSGGQLYVCTTSHTSASSGSIDGTKFDTIGVTSLSSYAPLASPALSGNPTAPTPSPGDNDTSVATTAFVAAAIAAAGTGGTTTVQGAPPATAVVYSSAFPYYKPSATDTAHYSWVCDGTSDEAEINAAIAAVAAQGGGKVKLLGDSFSIAGTIQLKTGVWLDGSGLGCIITAAGPFTGGMVSLYDNSVHLTTLSNLTLEGNNQDVGGGVYYSATGGQAFSSAPASNPDPAHRIENLYIQAIGTSTSAGHGMYLGGANLRAGKYTNIRIQSVTGCGIWLDGSVDSHFENIEIGSSGSGGPAASLSSTAPVGVGFYNSGANHMVVNCKTWYSRSVGFYNHGVRNSYANCQAQDNYSHGYQDAYGKCSFVGCHADSNGQTAASAGFYLAAVSSSLVGCLSYDRGGQGWTQAYGFQYTSSFQYSRITGCVTYGNSGSSKSGTAGVGTTVDIQADSAGN